MKKCSECHGEFQDTVQKCPTDNNDLDFKRNDPFIDSCLAERYQILSKIGSGGTGVVYKAQHLKIDRPVAIKMMHAHMMAQPGALRNFYDEAKTVAQLNHHNIITLYDFGITTTSQPFLVMDYIEGPSLKQYTQANGPISLEQMRIILAQIVEGLAYAHAAGVVHQDLKPENIILSGNSQTPDKVTIVDFGLATLASAEKEWAISDNRKKKFIGSPYYMSPEQCLSNAIIDLRSDIYSLAIVIYEALSDNLPFEKKSAMTMLDSHVRETPLPFKNSNTGLSGLQACTELTRVFNQAMAKEPNNRYNDISTFGMELDDALTRDAVKLSAIRHRSIAVEQALVHVKNHSEQNNQMTIENQGQAANLQLETGSQFLSRQAEIEEAYLNSIEVKDSENSQVSKNIEKENIIISFLKRLGRMCPTQTKIPIATNIVKQKSQCPHCKSPIKPGIQFCLNCQRGLTHQPVLINKFTDTRKRNYSDYSSSNAITFNQLQEVKTKLQNLRQEKLLGLIRAQQILNYALIAALIIGSAFFIQRCINMFIPEQNSYPDTSKNKSINNISQDNIENNFDENKEGNNANASGQ